MNNDLPDVTWNNATKEDIDKVIENHIEKFKEQSFGADLMNTMDFYLSHTRDINERGGLKEVFEDIGDKLDYYIVKRCELMKPIYEEKEQEFIRTLNEQN